MSDVVGSLSVVAIAVNLSADTVLPVTVSSKSKDYSSQMDTVSGGSVLFPMVSCAHDYVVSCQADGKSGEQVNVVVNYLEITNVTLAVV
jgi:hypothetical protein